MKLIFIAILAIAFAMALVSLAFWAVGTLLENFICWLLFDDEEF